MTAAVGYAVGGRGSFDSGCAFLVFLAGTALLCGGASALNQYLERDADARMERTRRRPLPAGPPHVRRRRCAFGLGALGGGPRRCSPASTR